MAEFAGLLKQLQEHAPEYETGHYDRLLDSLKKIEPGEDYITAALLAFAFADATLPEEITLSENTLSLYESLVRLHQLPINLSSDQQIERSRRIILSCSGDLALLTAFLIIKLHKLLFAQKDLPESITLAQETLSVYSSIANRLGIFWIKSEMEDRSFHLLHPDLYYELKHKVAKKRNERTQMVETLTVAIGQILNKAKLVHEVKGRYKRFYSIYEKLHRVEHDFERIQDLVAFRVLTHRVEDCYAALGYIHNHLEPKTGRFKDYITQPKANGYQSLHTTVLNEKQEPIEIQIRTYEMHQVAEYGVAAHWIYKEKQSVTATSKKTTPKINLYTRNIYPVTPDGDIVELPQGSNVIDFAYTIHTELGNRIVGAKVNQNIFKLDSALHTLDCVEILTSTRQTPHQEWLGTVKTGKARNKIRHAIHKKIREDKRKEGWEILDKEFKKQGLNLNRLSKEGKLEQGARQHKFQSIEQLVFSVGEGSTRSFDVALWFTDSAHAENENTKAAEPIPKKSKSKNKASSSGKKRVCVDGMEGVPIRHAKCCSPVAGQNIEGYITREHAIVIHYDQCPALLKIDPNRLIPVYWSD